MNCKKNGTLASSLSSFIYVGHIYPAAHTNLIKNYAKNSNFRNFFDTGKAGYTENSDWKMLSSPRETLENGV